MEDTMIVTSQQDLTALKTIGRIVALARDTMVKSVRPGMTTQELDRIGGQVLNQYGARSAPASEYDFPGFTCISINHEVAHGIPGPRRIKAGDMVNVDVSAELNGYFADTGATTIVPPTTDLKVKLCECSQKALMEGIANARPGSRVNRIGRAIFVEARQQGFTVIKNLTGHGIGRKLHEQPYYIPNYYDKGARQIIKEGMVLAVETFISSWAKLAIEKGDGWTLQTPDRSLVAQFEHTIIVTDNEPVILTMV
jgi:methionyl aminopeptidase